MENVSEAIKQDIAAAVVSFEQDDFTAMNMYANRVMANAVFGESQELFLTGFFFKDIAGFFMNLKAMPIAVPLSTAKTVALKYVSSLKEYASAEQSKVNLSWVSFYQYYRDMRRFPSNDIEGKVYFDNTAFTRHSFLWLIRYMKNHKEVLLDPNNLLFKAILNEFERIFRNHSGELDDVIAISLVRALDRLYNYLTIAKTPEGKIDESKLKSLVYPHIETMEQLAYPTRRETFSEVTHALWSITKQWREFFIQYMEPERVKPIEFERGIELPAEMRKKLAESVSKTLEKEVKPE
jgi:hypothetical protein